jgi:hypothetical protein
VREGEAAMPEPYTIRIFVPDGDPEGLRIVDRMNWTGCGTSFPRRSWKEVREREQFQRAGVYILIGTKEEDDLPTVYIGRAESIRSRIDTHEVEKEFWDRAIAFASNSGSLNQAHAMWLEHALIQRAVEANQCKLDNGNLAQRITLPPADEADSAVFLKEILQILPLLGVHAFEERRPIVAPSVEQESATSYASSKNSFQDTIIVPTGDPDDSEGFSKYFLEEKYWFPVRISGGNINKIKYVAAYQSRPISAVTHYAEVWGILPYGDDGKYRLIFDGPAQQLDPIALGEASPLRSPRYTNLEELKQANNLAELFSKRQY